MTISELKNTILAGGIDAALTEGLSVPADKVGGQRERYAKAADEFAALTGTAIFLSTPLAAEAKSPATIPTITSAGLSRRA